MRLSAYLCVILTFSLCNALAQTDTLHLASGWRFSLGDDPAWASPSFNDSAWEFLSVGREWETQGHVGYDGYAWYRTTVTVPSALVRSSFHHSGVKFVLGRIDDKDSTLLDGTLIGCTNNWESVREYIVKTNDLAVDRPLTLAIRVTDYQGKGGLYAPPYGVVPLTINDCLLVTPRTPSLQLTHQSGRETTVQFTLSNNSDEPVVGSLLMTAIDQASKKEIASQQVHLTVAARGVQSVGWSYIPPATPFIRYLLQFQEDSTHSSTLPAHFTSWLSGTDNPIGSPASVAAHVAVKGVLEPIPLDHERLGGLLRERIDHNRENTLLQIDEYRFLKGFYERPGEQDWIGEHIGKFLHSATITWLSTGDPALKSKLDRLVNLLLACQDSDGYLGTYSPVDRWTRWDVWVHKYDLVGLLAYYRATGFEPALAASQRIGDLLCRTFGEGPGSRDIIKAGEIKGMAATSVIDPMMDLYFFTANPMYLDFCRMVVRSYTHEGGPDLLNALLAKKTVMAPNSQKAYEMLSNLYGMLKMYRATGEKDFYRAATYAWDDIVNKRLYLTGSASSAEFFKPDHQLSAEVQDHICEGCVTTTWLQFNQELYTLTGEAKYADQIEKTTLNHLLGADNPHTGGVSNYTPLQGVKPYSCDISCCMSSVSRGISLIPGFVWYRRAKGGLALSVFSEGTMSESVRAADGRNVFVTITMRTDYPGSGDVHIAVTCDRPAHFPIAIRIPSWSKTFRARVFGKSFTGTPNSFVTLDRSWSGNDSIHCSMDLPVRITRDHHNYPGRTAVILGAQVLALDLSLNPAATKESDVCLMPGFERAISLATEALPKGWIGTQAYTAEGTIQGKPAQLVLVPFADAGQLGGDVRVWIQAQ